MNKPYTPGNAPPADLPIGRFLPPIPEGMVANWCQSNLVTGTWVVDPFGFSPIIAIEAASAGFPVLVTVNNPVHAFILDVLASAPHEDELIAAFQDLATAAKGEERIESFIRSLYEVNCGSCSKRIEANGFLWKKEAEFPYAALVDCPFCGAHGEQVLSGDMLSSLTILPPVQMHKARAINRIVEPGDPLRAQVDNALNSYPDRPLLILQTIINKLDGLEQSPKRRKLLTALILSAADKGNTLWAYPTPRDRPRQLVIPSAYQEINLWKALENSLINWLLIKLPIPVFDWNGSNYGQPGIYRYQGRFKDLEFDHLKFLTPAVITSIPRPNQAFWTLSTAWTGWLWGRQALAAILPVLSRQRYDWNWHTNAITSVLEAIAHIHHPKLQFLALIPEYEPMFLLSTLLAANTSGWQLSGFAVSMDDQLAQCYLQKSEHKVLDTNHDEAQKTASKKIANYLQIKGEPAHYARVHTAVVTGLAEENQLSTDLFMQNVHQAASETQKWIENLLLTENSITCRGDKSSSIETSEWVLKNLHELKTPLADRLETLILDHLTNVTSTTTRDVKNLVYKNFPGLLTPENDLLINCLESYAILIDLYSQTWQLRDSEQAVARNKDFNEITNHLKQIAQHLKFECTGQLNMLWQEKGNPEPSYQIHMTKTAMVANYLRQAPAPPVTTLIILPGSRANLLAYKIERDSLLREAMGSHIQVVKFRLVRDLAANPLLSRQLFEEQVYSDPPEYRSSQLALF